MQPFPSIFGVFPRAQVNTKISRFLSPLFSYLFRCFWDGVSLCSSGCPRTHYVSQEGLELTESLLSSAPLSAGIRDMRHHTQPPLFYCIYLFVCVHTHAVHIGAMEYKQTSEDNCKSLFSLSTVWDLGTEVRLSGLGARPFTLWASCWSSRSLTPMAYSWCVAQCSLAYLCFFAFFNVVLLEHSLTMWPKLSHNSNPPASSCLCWYRLVHL